MTWFGFIIGTVLVNTLFVFDLYITKYTNRTKFGCTLSVVFTEYGFYPNFFLTLLVGWSIGLYNGNDTVSTLQIWVSMVFWGWYFILFITSIYFYYVWDIDNFDGLFEVKKDK